MWGDNIAGHFDLYSPAMDSACPQLTEIKMLQEERMIH